MKKIALKKALIECAIESETISYKVALALATDGNPDRSLYPALFNLLTEIGDEECQAGRPPINCLVIQEHSDLIPGPKFYYWYGKAFNKWVDMRNIPAKKKLFQQLAEECHDYWKDVVSEMA